MDPYLLEELLQARLVVATDRTAAEAGASRLSINDFLQGAPQGLRPENSSASASEEIPPSTATSRLRDLQPMRVGDLELGRRHKGRALFGELCVEPLKMVAVHTMVADESGQEVYVSVYNALPRDHSAEDIRTLFPKGLKVAIKEPYFKVAMDGSHMIRVDNPSDFIRNPKIRGGSRSRMKSPSPSPLPSSSSMSSQVHRLLLYAGDLRSRGNQAFAGQDWKQAVQLYTDAVQFLSLCTGTFSSTMTSEMNTELALAFSNRAEARLRLKHFEAAKMDAGKALKLQPHHVKSLYRKGRALHGLHQYKEAVICFKEALDVRDENSMSIKELTEALKVGEICNKQASTGEYDLVCMWREVEKGKEPVCGEFIGPVIVGPASDRALGRGLLVTRDVEPGDLLLVSKVVALATAVPSFSNRLLPEGIDSDYKGSVDHEELAQQVLDRALSSMRFREQVYSLQGMASRGMGMVGTEKNIPAMDLFSAELESMLCDEGNDDASSSQENVDADRIRDIIDANAFEMPRERYAGLWLLPSFINNSCTPNSCWTKIGKEALFVRAARHLTKGQEVTISYIETPALPYSMRVLVFEHGRGFECRCQRCRFEKSLEHFTRLVDAKVAVQFTNIKAAMEVVESLEWAIQNIPAFENEQQKQWLRTSYVLSFVLTLRNATLQEMMKKPAPLETILRAVQETVGGSEVLLEMVSDKVHIDAKCSPGVKAILAAMYVCLYGKQPPATLRALLALHNSKSKKNFDMAKALDFVVAEQLGWQPMSWKFAGNT